MNHFRHFTKVNKIAYPNKIHFCFIILKNLMFLNIFIFFKKIDKKNIKYEKIFLNFFIEKILLKIQNLSSSMKHNRCSICRVEL